MKKLLIFIIAVFMIASESTAADSYLFQLSAGSSSIDASLDAKRYLDSGYLITGIGFIDVNNDDEEYTIAKVKLTVGSETLYPGLRCDLGFKGLIGSVEEDPDEGDIGGIGFFGSVAYILSERISPIPIEISASVCLAPGVLTLSDMDNYQEIKAGIGVYIVENAAIVLSYQYYDIRMDNDPPEWEMKDGVALIGLELTF
jgi:YfaZ precursor